jgi:hypothetical protein
MTRQERLLAEAIGTYPIGTQYIPLTDSGRAYSADDIATVVRTPNGNSDLIEAGPGYLYARGSWAEIVTVKTNLLQEAKRRYPVGTQVKSLFHRGNPILTITGDDFSSVRKDAIHVSAGGALAVVYENGEWAEIIDKDAILAKARKEYPEGTRYRPISSAGNPYDITVTVTREPNWHDSGGIEGGPGYIYYQGKWAQIVKTAENSIDYDAILAEAIRRYPVGASYNPLNALGKTSKRVLPSIREARWFEKKVDNSSRNPQDLIDVGGGYVYVDGKWAELAENNLDYDAILEIAKRKYPKGTKYMPLSSEGNLYTSAKISFEEAHWYNKKSQGADGDRIEIGYGFAYINGKWAEVVSTVKSIPTEEEVLRRYPKGTWYLPIKDSGSIGKIPKESKGIYEEGENYIWVNSGVDTGYVYDIQNQKWADVVPNPHSDFRKPSEEELIAEAYRRYPIGTKFISPDDKGAIRKVLPYGNNSTVVWVVDRHGKVRANNGMFNGVSDDWGRRPFCSNPHIYHEGVWAEIVHETSMPEYPVTTQEAYFPTEKLVARKEVLTKQSASQHKVEELPLLKIKKF